MLTILSLCDFTGEWSRPYREAGYDVRQVDIKHDDDVRLKSLLRDDGDKELTFDPTKPFTTRDGRAPHGSDHLQAPMLRGERRRCGDEGAETGRTRQPVGRQPTPSTRSAPP